MLPTSTVSPPNGSTSRPSWPSTSFCSRTAAASAAGRSTGSGTSSRCDSTSPCADPAPQLLVQDPLVQRVLVDDHHPVAGLGDQVAVVDLDRLERGSSATCAGSRIATLRASGARPPALRAVGRSPAVAGVRSDRRPDPAGAVGVTVADSPRERANSSNVSPGAGREPPGSDWAQAAAPSRTDPVRGRRRLEPRRRPSAGRSARRPGRIASLPAPRRPDRARGARPTRVPAARLASGRRRRLRRRLEPRVQVALAGRSAAASRAGGCRSGASRGTGPRSWSDGR